jgi:hypothetical protein
MVVCPEIEKTGSLGTPLAFFNQVWESSVTLKVSREVLGS